MALRDPEAGASPLALFGAELRHYRTAAGLSQEQLGDRIGYSAALVGAVETARRMPTEDFTARCDVVGELGTRGALLRLRAHLRDQLHRQVWPPWFREWPSIEREALSLRTWELVLIPGLLQTPDYARAILRGALPDATDEDIEQQVDARIGRQQILARQDPPMLWAIMDEAALRRPVGCAQTMRVQVAHLLEAAQKPKIKVLTVPASTGAHVGVLGPFVIAEFRDTADIAYLDTAAGGQIADHPEIVKACDQVFDTLRAEALPPRASLELIAEVRDIWT
ncbi:MAG: helix-turn-helix domain-containing protein [Streptosporangiaceae bacterium]